MKKKYLVWGAIATIVGVGYYYWKKSQDADDRKNEEAEDVDKGTPKSESASQENTSNTGNTPPKDNKNPDSVKREDWDKPTGLTEAQGNEFRGWFNDNYPEMAKAFKLDRTGAPDNVYIRPPFWKYKAEWNKYLASKSQSGATATQAKANKDTMDKLYMAWGGNASAQKFAGGSNGRELQISFEVAGQVLMPYKWSIIFFENKSGKYKTSYMITDGGGKSYQSGNFTFNGSKYDFTATGGTGKGQRAVTSTSLITALNSLTKRSASLA